jgi:diaminopimelate epimerase
MALRSLQKWQGAGNDFLVDVVEQGSAPWWNAQRARAVCNRHMGVGADGLIVAAIGSSISMTLYNSDGTTAEMSGNGIRCLVAAVRRATGRSDREMLVNTLAGERLVTLDLRDDCGVGSVDMGPVTLGRTLEGALGVAHVGNPHVVVVDNPDWDDINREEMAAKLAFQLGGANVEFVEIIDEEHVAIRVIERGVGWTLACGTGSVATAAVCHQRGLTGSEVTVDNPGGSLHVTLGEGGARLEGPVRFVANVEWLGG